MLRTELTITQTGDDINVHAAHLLLSGSPPTDGEKQMARGILKVIGSALDAASSSATDGEVAAQEPPDAD